MPNAGDDEVTTGPGASPIEEPGAPASGDSLKLSSDGKDFAAARKCARNAPDVRQARVEEAAAKIADGSLTTGASELALRILSGIGKGEA